MMFGQNLLAVLSFLLFLVNVKAWSPRPLFSFGSSASGRILQTTTLEGEDTSDDAAAAAAAAAMAQKVATRRVFLGAAAMNIGLIGAAQTVLAESNNTVDSTIYKSGKAPIVPGQKPRDKSDLKGTRKDPDFLRSVADCRSQCQSGTGPDGYARAKEDCLSECQDICCKTYEQCTFDIVPRI